MFKRIAPLLIAVGLVVGFAPSAFAGGSGPQPPATVSGNSITITSTGNLPGETVNFTLYDDAKAPMGGNTGAGVAVISLKLPSAIVATKSATANAQGEATVTFTDLPAGTYSAVSIGETSGNRQTFDNITVQGSTTDGGTTAGGSLPETGSDSSLPLARFGIVLVALGGVAVYFAQRRRKGSFIDA